MLVGAVAAYGSLAGVAATAEPARPAAMEPVAGSDGGPYREQGWSVWQVPGTRYRFEEGRLALISGLLVRAPETGAPPPAPVLSAPREVVPGRTGARLPGHRAAAVTACR